MSLTHMATRSIADRVEDAAFDRDLDLGADAVVGGDQDGIAKARRLEVEQAAEAADLGVGAGAARRPDQRLDALDHGVARIDVDPGVGVSQARRGFRGHGGLGEMLAPG